MNLRTLFEFVRESGLVERDEGDVICRYNDPSDNMFLILRGRVGVYLPRGEACEVDDSAEPDFKAGGGEIVGELAFALKRRRTATVRALERTSLLAFSYTRLKELLEQPATGSLLTNSLDAYLKSRVLKFVFDTAEYLSLPLGTSTSVSDPWEYLVDRTHIVSIENSDAVLSSAACAHFAARGGLGW